MEGLKVNAALFVTHFDATEVAEPTERPLDHVPSLPETASMWHLFAVQGKQGFDSSGDHLADHRENPVCGVALQDVGPRPRSAATTCDSRDTIQHRDCALTIALVVRTRLYDQRYASRIGNYVAFTASFGAVRGIRSGVRPPKSARTEALSITARDSRIDPRFPRRRNKRRWTSGQTPCRVQSRIRRQQVTPLPHPISGGNMFQGRPLLSRNTMPVKQARSDTGGRPPLGEAACLGNSGSISFHSAFGTNSDILFASLLNKKARY